MGDYSSGDEASLPADTTNLDHVYDATDLSNVQTNDTNYVDQTGSSGFEIHQYKDSITATSANVTWIGKSSLAPSSSKVQLQVYKVATPAGWQDVSGAGASNNVAAADTDFTLSGTIATADYLDSGVTTFRIYQSSSSMWPVTGVTKPTHWYPFKLTGNATDQGTGTPLNLSVGAGTPTYSNGLVLDGSSYLVHAADTDLNELGGSYAILVDFTHNITPVFPNAYGLVATDRSVNYGLSLYGTSDPLDVGLYYSGVDQLFKAAYFSGGVRYQIICYTNGSSAVGLAINGVYVDVYSNTYTIPSGLTATFKIGMIPYGSDGYFKGTINYVGILKGSLWSTDDIAAIYDNLT